MKWRVSEVGSGDGENSPKKPHKEVCGRGAVGEGGLQPPEGDKEPGARNAVGFNELGREEVN